MVEVSGIPFELTPSESWEWRVADRGVATTAKPRADIFINPVGAVLDGAEPVATVSQPGSMDAVTLLGEPPEGDFVLSARVEVDFASAFDAGVLLVKFDETHWAKLCFEYSPDLRPMVVSVVARGVSDDANGEVIAGGHVWLRIARLSGAWAFHSSLDGRRWELARLFALDVAGVTPVIGFEAQSPTGEGCEVRFSEVSFESRTLGELRDGS